jgi:two-component system KDP operon response regulator KdpE
MDWPADTWKGESFMPRILILEDYPPLRRVQAVTLQRAGWSVVSAMSAQETIRAIERNGFDVLLLDMDIATGESWTVLQALHASCDSYPVVALLDPDNRRQPELVALGAKVILYKPVGRETLLMGIDMALQDTDIRIF